MVSQQLKSCSDDYCYTGYTTDSEYFDDPLFHGGNLYRNSLLYRGIGTSKEDNFLIKHTISHLK